MNTPEELLAERRDIVHAYGRFDLAGASETSERQFAFFDANLSNCFPGLNRAAYLDIFKQMHLNRRLSFHDMELMHFPELVRITGWDADWAAGLRRMPAIIVTYHTGSYRMINFLLAQAGVPFSLLVSGTALHHEHRERNRLYASVAAQTGMGLDMQLIDAEQPKALLQLSRAAKAGRTLLAYIDGNTGTPVADKDRHNLLQIDFGRQHLAVRVGLASLAYRLEVPIYPVRCRRRGMDMERNRDIRFEHLPAIMPVQPTTRPFAHEATASLYQYLASLVTDHPEQWEGWLTLHHKLADPPATAPTGMTEPLSDWAVYRRNQQFYLLHKPSYTHYPLHPEQYQSLKIKLTCVFLPGIVKNFDIQSF